MVSLRLSNRFPIVPLGNSSGFRIAFTWHLAFLWVSYVIPLVFLFYSPWLSFDSCGSPIVFLWVFYGIPTGFPLIFYCFPVVLLPITFTMPTCFLRHSHGFPPVFLWEANSFRTFFLSYSDHFPTVFACFSYGAHIFSYGIPAVVLWYSIIAQLFLWLPYCFLLLSCGVPVVVRWLAYGSPTAFLLLYCGFLWFSNCSSTVSIWYCYGVP